METKLPKKLDLVQLSNNTIKGRIDRMSQDIFEQLFNDLKQAGKFSVPIDKSVHIEDNPQLMVLARYKTDDEIVKEFFFCKPLGTTTVGEDIF